MSNEIDFREMGRRLTAMSAVCQMAMKSRIFSGAREKDVCFVRGFLTEMLDDLKENCPDKPNALYPNNPNRKEEEQISTNV